MTFMVSAYNSASQGRYASSSAVTLPVSYTHLDVYKRQIFSSRYYIAGKPILDEKGMLQGFVFAGANADSLTEYLANLFSKMCIRDR